MCVFVTVAAGRVPGKLPCSLSCYTVCLQGQTLNPECAVLYVMFLNPKTLHLWCYMTAG